MKRIIVYRYFHNFPQNSHLLRFIRHLNPGVNIFGLYGGPKELFNDAEKVLKEHFTHNYLIPVEDTEWKWKNGDMTYQMWFRDVGQNVYFDIMHAIEYDLLYFEPLDKLFAHVPKDALALTGLIPLHKIEKDWFWTKRGQQRIDWEQLMKYFKENYGYNQNPFGMLGPGTSLPRVFLEKIKDIDIPDLCLDELRIPMLAQVHHLAMYDTGFYQKWFSQKEWKVFNSNAVKISLRNIHKQLKKQNGRRVFHPFREEITFDELMSLYHKNARVEKSSPDREEILVA